MKNTCSIEGCLKPAQCKSMCSMHYSRWHDYGRLHLVRRESGTGAITKAGYVSICKDREYKYEHVRIAEKAIGKPLPAGCVVHHVDENPSNNTPTNLVVCPDAKYHRLLHRRTDALNACGNPNFIVCRHCGKYDDPQNMKSAGPRSLAHTECRSEYRRGLYQERKANGKSV